MVDGNRIDGSAKNLGGKIQDAVGELTGDSATQARGKLNQAAGSAQDALGSAMDNAERWMDSVSEMAKSRPLTTVALAIVGGYTLRALTHWGRG